MGKMKELAIVTDNEQGRCVTCEFVHEMIKDNLIDRRDIEDWHCKECEERATVRRRAISAVPRGREVAG